MGDIGRLNTSIPHTHQAVIVENPGPTAQILVKKVEVPECADDEILIRLSYSGICHADVAFAFDEWNAFAYGFDGSRTPGHEGVGEVVMMGKNVDNFSIGDRVGTKWIRRVCRACDYCRDDEEGYCMSAIEYGRTSPGSLQQYITSPANFTPRIPSGIPSEKAGPLLCAGVTVYRSLKQAGLRSEAWVVIPGAGGGLGHLGVQFALKMGFNVIGIDSGDKAQFCQSLGLKHFLDFRSTVDVPGEVKKITGQGAHLVLVLTSSRTSYEQAKQMLRKGGGMVCIGVPHEQFPVPFLPIELMAGSNWIAGSGAPNLAIIQEALNFAALHGILPVVQTIPLAEAEKALELLREGKALGRIVLHLA